MTTEEVVVWVSWCDGTVILALAGIVAIGLLAWRDLDRHNGRRDS